MPLAEGLYPGEGAYIRMYFSFTGKWPYNWGLISREGEGGRAHKLQLRKLTNGSHFSLGITEYQVFLKES